MKIHIVSIGSELLLGSTLNTNSHFLCQKLTKNGYLVNHSCEVSDEPTLLKKELIAQLEQADLVITTGGLGPTFDDLTREVVCEIFETKLVLFPDVKKDLIERYGKDLPSIDNQSMQPQIARILPNTIGTAPGLYLEKEDKRLIMLPGVPSQMKEIFSSFVMPMLIQEFPTSALTIAQVHFALITENNIDPIVRNLQQKYPGIDFGIYPDYGTLTVRMLAPYNKQNEIKQIQEKLFQEFDSFIYSTEEKDIEKAFHQKMIQKKKTFALAESCTGGQFASRLTALADASTYFLGSLVTYSNEAKQVCLGVKKETLETHGAVSEECVREMAEGLFHRFDVDFVAAISGIAGPSGGTAEKPIGTVWVCYGTKDHLQTALVPVRKHLPRSLIVTYTINWLLAKILLEQLNG